MTKTLTPIAPVFPVAPYLGGKKRLAARIIARLQLTPHECYVEPFVGMGGIFLRRPFRAYSEVINDASGDVANFFRVLQWHYEAFLDMLRWQLTSREQFDLLKAAQPETLTDLQRAARFLYLQRTAYGGKVEARSFGVSTAMPARFDVGKLAPQLLAVHDRLASVVIERLPWHDLLPRYDRPGTLFYCDPPYYLSEADYGRRLFTRDDFARLAEALASLKGAFLLSLNDHPDMRRCFSAFDIQPIATTYSIAGAGRTGRVVELLISKGVKRGP
jgi:DNA adenine methylase